ncbi:unnamed protein product, partial [Staurois parvus]
SFRRVPAQFWSSGRTVRGEEFVTLPRLHPDSQCLPRSAGRIIRVLTFGAAAREEGGERAPGTQKSCINLPGERGLPTTELQQPYCLSPGGQCAPEPQQR